MNKIGGLSDVFSAEKTDDKSLRITISGEMAVRERILQDLVALKIGVVSYRSAASELEETYLKLIRETL